MFTPTAWHGHLGHANVLAHGREAHATQRTKSKATDRSVAFCAFKGCVKGYSLTSYSASMTSSSFLPPAPAVPRSVWASGPGAAPPPGAPPPGALALYISSASL